MKNKLLIPLLALTLVCVFGWGYSQYQMRRQWEINAENQYQLSFEDLTGHAGNMETAMSKALVASSFPQTITLLTNIWREANSCQQAIGQLPLSSVELSRTKTMFSKISAFCFNAAQNRLLKGTAPDESQWKTLNDFRSQTQLMFRHLTNLRQEFYQNRAQWLQVDRLGTIGAAGLASDFNNNKVTKAFLMLEDGLKRTPDVVFQGNNLDFVPKATGLTGHNITSAEAITVARNFLGPQYRNAKFKYDHLIQGGFPSFMITVTDSRRPELDCRLSVSVKGGHVAWMLGNKTVTRSRLNPEQIKASALGFLSQKGYSNMKPVSRESYANITTLTLVPERRQILRYPEFIKLQVAQDNGMILGYDAIAYLTFNDPREAPDGQPQVSNTEIKRQVNPHLNLKQIRMAQVLDEMFNKVLCYEVSGTQKQDQFLIYYNA
ncbi:MAG TPA: PepSY1/2 domain-containing protein, partial [Bacillota bacterium]|nr:PepSY1/2 domain-containing protein [Bacillota bacterium]